MRKAAGSLSICFEHEVIVGDLIAPGIAFAVLNTLMDQRDVQTLRKSIRRILAHHPTKIYTGHSGILDYESVQKLIAQ